MEAGEYGLTCGTCFVAHRLEVVAVAGLLWISWCFLGGAFFFFFFSCFFFLRTYMACCKWPAASLRLPCLIYLSTSTDCEGCTRLICTNPGSMGASEYGLTRGTCFVARRLEEVAVAGLLWTSWCVLSGADFFLCECFRFFSSSNAHGLLQV